ncbi:MAG: low molecular weight protein arginine phosphatase [Gemmatimonadales bacterium]
MNILLVCTGNTCRSPLAEAMLRREFERLHVSGVEVGSAGTGAMPGAPVSEGSYLVGLENGLDLSGHRARQLSRELVAGADLILTMSERHLGRVEELGGRGRGHMLGVFAGVDPDEADVADPFGADLEEYRITYLELEPLITAAAVRITESLGGGPSASPDDR